MPKASYFNLPEDKRNIILAVAMDEFSASNYEAASTNQICKKSNIAKGSFYQYFEDKLDLYVYIMKLGIEAKVTFFSDVLNAFDTLQLKDQMRLLFAKGIDFAKAYPKYAALGDQFAKESCESARSAVMQEGERQSESLFIKMIETAKSKGEISQQTDTLALSMMFLSLNKTVSDYMLNKFGNMDYERYEDDVNHLVDSLLGIIFNGVR